MMATMGARHMSDVMTATERRAREECDDEACAGESGTMMSGDDAMMMDGDGKGERSA